MKWRDRELRADAFVTFALNPDGSIDQAIFGMTGPDGEAKPGAVARFLITQPWRIPQLARLARGLSLATNAAATACTRALETL